MPPRRFEGDFGGDLKNRCCALLYSLSQGLSGDGGGGVDGHSVLAVEPGRIEDVDAFAADAIEIIDYLFEEIVAMCRKKKGERV